MPTIPWRRILGKETPDTRKKDVELIIRFFAMRNISAYKKPMKDFLSKFMKINRDAPPQVLNESRELFLRTCEEIVDTLGQKPFHIRAGLNAAVFDAVMVAFSNHLDSIPGNIHERFENLLADESFDESTRQATTDLDTVQERFRQAEAVLFG